MLQKYIFTDFCLLYLGVLGAFVFLLVLVLLLWCLCVIFRGFFACFIYFGLLFSLGIYLELSLADYEPTLLIPGKQKC